MARTKVVDGVTVPLTEAEEAARDAEEVAWAAAQAERDALAARLAADMAERQACCADSGIIGLINQTRAEWLTWAGNNFPSLTNAEKARLGILFWVVAVGVRRELR